MVVIVVVIAVAAAVVAVVAGKGALKDECARTIMVGCVATLDCSINGDNGDICNWAWAGLISNADRQQHRSGFLEREALRGGGSSGSFMGRQGRQARSCRVRYLYTKAMPVNRNSRDNQAETLDQNEHGF